VVGAYHAGSDDSSGHSGNSSRVASTRLAPVAGAYYASDGSQSVSADITHHTSRMRLFLSLRDYAAVRLTSNWHANLITYGYGEGFANRADYLRRTLPQQQLMCPSWTTPHLPSAPTDSMAELRDNEDDRRASTCRRSAPGARACYAGIGATNSMGVDCKYNRGDGDTKRLVTYCTFCLQPRQCIIAPHASPESVIGRLCLPSTLCSACGPIQGESAQGRSLDEYDDDDLQCYYRDDDSSQDSYNSAGRGHDIGLKSITLQAWYRATYEMQDSSLAPV
jgi:hypothetical protein